MDERRQVPRWQINREAGVSINGEAGVGHSLVENINLKGMCLTLPDRLPQLGSTQLSLTIEDGLFIDVDVRVPWVREHNGRYRHGVFFYRIKDQDRESIYKYVNRRFPELFQHCWWDATTA